MSKSGALNALYSFLSCLVRLPFEASKIGRKTIMGKKWRTNLEKNYKVECLCWWILLFLQREKRKLYVVQ